MEIYQEILRALGRIEGELIEIRRLSQRVSILEQCQSRLKGALCSPPVSPTCSATSTKNNKFHSTEEAHVFVSTSTSILGRRCRLLDLLRRRILAARSGAERPAHLPMVFRFLHTVAGNITTAFANKIPVSKGLILLLALPLVLSGSACAASHFSVHACALNAVDSATYDTLLVAESAIDTTRDAYQSGRLCQHQTRVRPPAALLHVAHESWLTYREESV